MAADRPETITLEADMFLGKTTTIYGITGWGKSTVIKHIMRLLCPQFIGRVIVFCASDRNNGGYSKAHVPPALVHDAASPEIIEAIYKTQEQYMRVYAAANKLAVWERFFREVASPEQQRAVEESYDRRLTAIDRLSRDSTINDSVRLSKRQAIEEAHEQFLLATYKKTVVANLHRMRAANAMSTEERVALEWRDFNPRTLIVFDDCTTDLQKIAKCKSTLEAIFQGRHIGCTVIFAVHSDKYLPPEARINSSVSIFVHPGTVRMFVGRGSNPLDRDFVERLNKAAKLIQNGPTYEKVIVLGGERIGLFVATVFPPFSAVSREIREAASGMLRGTEAADDDRWMSSLIQ